MLRSFIIFACGALMGGIVVFLKYSSQLTKTKYEYEILKKHFDMQSNNAQLVNNFGEQLKNVSSSLLNHFYEKTEHHFRMKTEAIDSLIHPVKTILCDFRKDILNFQTIQAEERGSLKSQITELLKAEKNLEKETINLTNILKCPGTRGHWGEMQLKRILELSGMLRYCDFTLQETSKDLRSRPDAIIKLPDDKILVVDAKSPLSDSYLSDGLNKADLVLKIREHIKSLRQKAYWEQFPTTPEFVILFLPGESLFNDALKEDPLLIDFGYQSNVFLTSPVTLLAMLKTVAFAWKQENLHRQIEKIGTWGKKLYSRLAILTGHLNKIGKNLNASVNSYNDALSSLERRVLVAAREFENFDVMEKTDKLEMPEILEAVARYPMQLQSENLPEDFPTHKSTLKLQDSET